MSDLLESLDNIRTLQDLADRYVLGSLLGEGRFSKVWSATPSTSDAVVASSTTPVALKEIALDVLEDDEEAFEMLEAEVAALRHASTHDSLGERVVKLHEVVKTDEYIFLVLDRVPGDELFNVIDERGHLPLPTVHSIMRQLLSALTALHGLGIVHRDIKPENLMVDGLDDLASLRLTLIDFGYADVKCGGAQLQRLAGSPEYAAPEVLSWLSEDGEPYDARCDVWSAGITAHVLLSGELPFELPEEADEDAIAEIAKAAQLDFEQPVWRHANMDAPRAFVCACLTSDPAQRPTAAEASTLSWLANPAAALEATLSEAATERNDAVVTAVTGRSEASKEEPLGDPPLGDHSC